ncbi:MAG: prepilin-type N-terminal cleavage/methylation domain-containing protein [Deltaproteobacteria bacterium]|nr:MAG: prepilin-type N-terminal cleavage/methylation domain-containing protein [Deltaproteobacteria bacterium]
MQSLRNRYHRSLGRSLARGHRGMTLLEIMIVLAILALVMTLLVGPKVLNALRDSRSKTTKIKLNQYANEAFPQWAAAHPDKGCPDKLTDLNDFMNSNDANDAWGRPIKMMCGASLPPGVKGLATLSMGEDGKEGTEDDVKSWE